MVKVIKHPVNGMGCIAGKGAVLYDNGVISSVPEYEDTLKMAPEELTALVQSWEQNDKRTGYDWKYAVTTGILRKKPVRRSADDKTEDGEDAVVIVPGEHKAPLLTPATVIFVVMVAVGLVSAAMSAYHTAVALAAFGRPLLVGAVTGTVMVLFSATAFTAGRWFMQEKGPVRLFSVLFISLGLVIVAYSMLSTLTVNYDAWSGTEEAEEARVLEGSSELAVYNKRLSSLEKRIASQQEETVRLAGEASYWQTMSWARYDDISKQLQASRDKEDELSAEYDALLLEEPTASSMALSEDRPGDVFSFLTGLFGGDADIMRLFMQAVPAMFFDVIAPFALSCAVYLSEKRRRNG